MEQYNFLLGRPVHMLLGSHLHSVEKKTTNMTRLFIEVIAKQCARSIILG